MFKFKKEIIKNASTMPKVYYGLHFDVGVAEYRDNEGAKRILIDENCAKLMDATFPGRPVYVYHVDSVNLDNLQNEADGYVVESFFNKSDGKHWAKFIVVSDRGHEAIRNGWKLSNAYFVKEKGAGGQWHGVDYNYEVTRAEYEHLAIVPNPRYDESIVLTPEQFKEYNERKEAELKKLTNSKGDSMLKFFKRETVQNSIDMENMSVELPKSKIEIPLSRLVNEMDEVISNKGKPVVVNSTDIVKVGSEEMTVADLITKFENACKKNEEHEKAKEENEDEEKEENEEDEVENEDEEEMKNKKKNKKKNKEDEKKENEEDEEKAKNSDDFFNKVKNAHKNSKEVRTIETSADAVARGKKKYGLN